MKVLVWTSLFVIFSIYTYLVYSQCDQKDSPATQPDAAALAGFNTWQQKNCQTCHQLYGLGGYMGPDLTNIASDPVKNEAYIRAFITTGTAKMPNFHLKDEEINNIIAFLRWVDKSGRNIVPKEKVTLSGNYNLDH